MPENIEDKKHLVAVTALILNKKGSRFLIAKRSEKEIAHPGKWAFPGGRVERGETCFETLKREILEEVGLEIDDHKEYLKDYTFIRPDGHSVIGLAFLVRPRSEEVKLSEDFDDFKWVGIEEFKTFDHIPGMEEEVHLAFNNIKKISPS